MLSGRVIRIRSGNGFDVGHAGLTCFDIKARFDRDVCPDETRTPEEPGRARRVFQVVPIESLQTTTALAILARLSPVSVRL